MSRTPEKRGIPYLLVLEKGLKFDCPMLLAGLPIARVEIAKQSDLCNSFHVRSYNCCSKSIYLVFRVGSC